MSSNNDSPKRDYRGRGKRAAHSYHSRFTSEKPILDTAQMRPINADAVSAANVGQMPLVVDEDDPFAPKTTTQEFAAAMDSREAIKAAEAQEKKSASQDVPVIRDVQEPAPQKQPADEVEDVADAAEDAKVAEQPEEQAPEVQSNAVSTGAQVDPNRSVNAITANTIEPAEDAPDITLLDLPTVEDSGAAKPVAAAPVVPVITQDAVKAANGEADEYSRGSDKYTHRGRFSKGQKTALIIIAVVAVILCAIAGVFLAMWQNAQENIQLKDDSIKETLAASPVHGEPYWVLVLGSDKRPSDTSGEPTRSDVIMLARIDEVNKKVTLVSIPRDSKVVLDSYGTQKINAAFALGGAKLAVSTISDFAGVDITHYVEVYFDGFKDLVDEIGGVDVDVPERASYKGVTIKPGKQHLNGKEALTLARNRKTYATGDFRRTECQRLLVTAIAQKVLSQDASQIPGTIDSLTKCFSTDMPLSDVLGLALSMQGITGDSFYSAMAPSTIGMIDGASYTFTYINRWKLVMQRAVNGQDPKIDDGEANICGNITTEYEDLDMSEGLPSDISQDIAEYEEQKAKEAAEKETKAQKKASKKSSSSEESGSEESGSEEGESSSSE